MGENDRTKPPPGRRWCCDHEHDERFISGYPSRPSLERAWADHDLVQAAAERRGYMLALEKVRNYGADLPEDLALTDEERYILPQAAGILEGEAPGEPTP